ncbi:MAG: Crp/Fnr family transcriptional regulator [Marinibacterium sp.]|nr:Crp/Fnr family transcriptional regulator [Marinibacterium sp.]
MTVNDWPATGFLAHASDHLKQALTELAREVRLAAGEVLFEEGDIGDALYAVKSGRLEVSVMSQDGRKLSLDVMRPGSLFGEIAMFDPGPRTATLTGLEPCTLMRVRNSDLLQAVERSPALGSDLTRLAGQRMRWMSQRMNEQVFLAMPVRLARKVLYLTSEQNGARKVLALSQSELAEYVGASREAVSKTISAWRKQNVVEPTRGGLIVLDRKALTELAELGTG